MQAQAGTEKIFDIAEIINGEHVTAYFQPLISVQKKAIIGFEGLTRGIHPEDKSLIPPIDLFVQANARGLNHDLDLLCREKILESFLAVKKAYPDVVLTLNIG